MKLRVAMAAGLLALGSTATTATETNWGVHPLFQTALGVVAGSFTDYFDFEITQTPFILSSTVVANNLHNDGQVIYNITGGQYEVWWAGLDNQRGGPQPDSLVPGATFAFTGSTGSLTHHVVLDPGEYYYKLTGVADGNAGGLYLLTSAINPVPEPETLAMYLAGLGVVGYLARRRRGAA